VVASSPQTLILLMSDCEGYEDLLLDPQKAPELLYCDILVELRPLRQAFPKELKNVSRKVTRSIPIAPCLEIQRISIYLASYHGKIKNSHLTSFATVTSIGFSSR